MSKWLVTSAVAAILANVASMALADQQQPTNVGRVSTGGQSGNGQAVVKPSPEKDRAAAIEEKKEAPNVIDVQPLNEILKLPDVNMAEALQRVPGISLETDTGEGRFIHIRGLDADLNATTYGGVILPASNASSPSGGERAVAFDTFPTGIVGGVEVVKTLRPDMDAEGLGGSINLVPRSGAEHGGAPFLDADLGYGYEDLRDTNRWLADVSAGRGFDGGDGIGGLFAGQNALSAVVSVVYDQDSRGIDDVEESYDDEQASGVPDKVLSDIEYRRYLYHRKRYGAAANFDARATETTSLYARFLYSGYIEGATKHYLVWNNLNSDDGCSPLPTCIVDPNNPNGFIASQAQMEQDTTDSLERIQNELGILGGTSVFPTFKLDYHISYAVGSDLTSSDYGSQWDDPNPVPVAYDSTTNPKYPVVTTLDQTNPADPANYTLTNIGFGPSLTRDQEAGGALDATIPIGSGDDTGNFKLGLSARLRHKTNSGSSPVFTPFGTISLADYTVGPPQIYYNDLYNIGPAINLAAIRALVGNTQLGTVTDDPIADAAQDADDREDVYAGYVQYQQRFGKAGVLTGLRVESTDAWYTGNLYNPGSATVPESNIASTVKNSYTNYFPSLQGRYDFLNDLVGRLIYSTGIARPGFQQINPAYSYSTPITSVGQTVQVGNPTLKPTTEQGFDATLEYYPGDGQIAAVGAFYKDFHNYILLSQQFISDFSYPGGVVGPATLQTWSNGPGHVEGIEAQWEQKLLFLPAPLDGLGFNLNGTLVHSWAQFHPGISSLLPSTSKVTWNAEVFYERGPVEVRVAADYVGLNLFAYGSYLGNALDDYSQPRLTLDAGASYAVTDYLQLYAQAKNLLNTPLEFTEGTSTERPIQREFYDVTYFAGVRLKL